MRLRSQDCLVKDYSRFGGIYVLGASENEQFDNPTNKEQRKSYRNQVARMPANATLTERRQNRERSTIYAAVGSRARVVHKMSCMDTKKVMEY